METPLASGAPGLLTETLQTVSALNTPIRVEMVLRIWSPSFRDTDPAPDGPSVPQHAELLAFIEDLVDTREGKLQAARSQLYIRGLTKPTDALVIARRIQLGMQGFRGLPGSEPVAVSIAIDSSSCTTTTIASLSVDKGGADEPPAEPSHDLLTLLKLSRPAQILVTHDLCLRSTAVKCLPLKSFPARFGVFEYLWTSPDRLELLEADPQLTLATVPIPSASGAESTPTAPPPVRAATRPAAEPAIEKRGRAKLVFNWRAALRSPRVAVFAVLLAIVAAIVLLMGYRLTHKPVAPTTTVASNPASVPSSAGASGSQSATHSATPPADGSSSPSDSVPATQAQDSRMKHFKQSRQTKEQRAADKPAQPSAECKFPGQISERLDHAERARGQGDYSRAIRLSNDVLACDPNNAKAKSLLERAYSGLQQSHRQQ